MTQAIQQEFRYAIMETPKSTTSGKPYMVVDQRKVKAEFFGDHEECQDWISRAIQR